MVSLVSSLFFALKLPKSDILGRPAERSGDVFRFAVCPCQVCETCDRAPNILVCRFWYLDSIYLRNIVLIFDRGNHDSEIADDRATQMRALMNMPYSLAQAGPDDVDGVGNCMLVIAGKGCRLTHGLNRSNQALLGRYVSERS